MFLWLSSGHLKAETETEITEAQDQELWSKYHETKILQQMQTTSTIWQDNRPHCISITNNGERTVNTVTW